MQNMEWYALLSKPVLTPPDAVFGMVWPVLYVMIFVALAVYWKTKSEIKKTTGYVCFFIVDEFVLDNGVLFNAIARGGFNSFDGDDRCCR